MWDEAIYQNLKQSKHLRHVSYYYHCCDDDSVEEEDGIRESGVSMQLCPVTPQGTLPVASQDSY